MARSIVRLSPVAAIFLATASLSAQPAFAQDDNDIRVRVGLGGQVRPEYLGGKYYELAPLWDVSVQRGADPFDFEAPDDNLDFRLFSKGGFSIGPVASIQGKRKESDVGAPVGKVPTTFEAGAFAQYDLSSSIRMRTEVRKGIGGHEGLVAALGGDYVWRDGDRYLLSLGPRLLLSNGRYQRAWFGVSPEASAASGLPEYRPGGGVHAVAATSGFNYQLDRRFGLFGFVRYERLVGDAANSPIIRDLGSRNQFAAGLGATYTFTIVR